MSSLVTVLLVATASASPSPSPAPVTGSIDWPVWLTAIGTVGAVVVALILAVWGEWVRSLRFRPKLDITIEMKPPDCNKIRTREERPPGRLLEFDSYYCRPRVWNKGNVPAREVEVTLLKLHRVEKGRVTEDPNFFPLRLRWSHVSRTVMPIIPPGLFRQVDLCHRSHPGSRANRPGNLFQFDTEVEPNEVARGVWPTWKGPGEYRLDLVVAADNAKPTERTLAITFNDAWTDDEAEMFAKNLVVRVVGHTRASLGVTSASTPQGA